MVAVSPIFSVLLLEEIVMVGAMVSTAIESCGAGELLLPAASVKAPEVISRVAVVLLEEAGVKVAE